MSANFRILVLIISLVWMMPAVGTASECTVFHENGLFDLCRDRPARLPEWLNALEPSRQWADSRIRLVKFDGPIRSERREALEDLGAEILDYFPRHAYVVRMNPALDSQVRHLGGVVAVSALPPALKVGRSVTDAVRRGEFTDQAMPLDISLWPGESLAERGGRIQAVTGLNVAFEQRGPRSERLVVLVEPRSHQQAIVELAGLEAVSAIGIYREPVYLNSQGSWLHQSGVSGNTPIFDQGIFGCGQTIGVLDSGVDFGHCAFVDPDQAAPPISECDEGTSCPAGTPDPDQRTTSLYYKWSSSTSSLGDAACNPSTGAGHGTHVAASAVGNNLANPADCDALSTPGNQTNLDGTAPGAKLIAQEMGEQLEYLNQFEGTLYHAAEVARESGARIHNNSWGIACVNRSTGQCIPDCTDYRPLTRDTDFLAWDFPDMAVFVAAGNDGTSSCAEQVGAPGNAKNIFSVGSNNRGTSGENVSNFSSRGPIVDGRTKPDVMAQGGGIHSAASSGDPGEQTCSTCTMSGTSMASPTAAGTAALVREYLERGFYPSGVETPSDAITNPSSALVKAIMINSSRFMTGTGGGDGPNQNQGWGRVTLDDALYFDGDSRRLFIAEPVVALETDDVVVYSIEVGGGEPFKATLTWTDYPAALNAGIHLVNQLRLEVESPSGEVWTQKLDDGDPDPYQGTGEENYDELNNVHQIRFDTPDSGLYRVRVRAVNVAMGEAQSYALAVNGEVAGSTDPTFNLSTEPVDIEVCQGDPAIYTASLLAIEGFDDPVGLSISSGLPPGAGVDFSVNPVVPADPAAQSNVTISTGSADIGVHAMTLLAESDPDAFDPVTRGRDLGLRIVTSLMDTADPLIPANGATGVALAPILEWSAVDQASAYRVQLAMDGDFSAPMIDETVTGTSFPISEALDDNTIYFWRVAALNACGEGDFSDIAAFTTLVAYCSAPGSTLPSGNSVEDTLVVSADGSIADIQVAVRLDFDWPGDLVASLTHVDSRVSVDLFDRPGVPDGDFNAGCSTPDVNAVFVDGAPSVQNIDNCSSTPPGLGGQLGPAQALADLVGLVIGSGWTLTVTDEEGFEADGMLHEWCLLIDVQTELQITALDPSWVLAGSDAFTLTVTGGGFHPDSIVRLDGVDQSTHFVSSSQLNADIPASAIEEAGSIEVTVHDSNADVESEPLVLNVISPDSAIIEGIVQGLGYCSSDPAALADVQIEAGNGSAGVAAMTDTQGFYRLVIDAAESPVSVSASITGHIDDQVDDVNLTAEEVSVVNFDLLLEAPCADVSPQSLSDVVAVDDTVTTPLTLVNDGGQGYDWTITIDSHQPQGGQSAFYPASSRQPSKNSDQRVLASIDDGVRVKPGKISLRGASGPTLSVEGKTAANELGSGDSGNSTGFLNIGIDNEVIGIGWNVTIEATGDAWLSDAAVALLTGPEGGGIVLSPGSDDEMSGSGSYSSGGVVMLEDAGLDPVSADAEGQVYLEWFDAENFSPGTINLFWSDPESGDNPEPGLRLVCTDQQACDAAVGAEPEEPEVCDDPTDVGWLSVDTTDGSVAALDQMLVNVQYDADGLEPGDYEASLCIETTDVGNALIIVPVSMTVREPTVIEGTVTSLGYCSAQPAAGEGALVEVIAGSGAQFSTAADSKGFYTVTIPADESTANVQFSLASHLDDGVTSIDLDSTSSVILDIDLLLDAPCATVSPLSISERVGQGEDESFVVMLGNVDGAAALIWSLAVEAGEGGGCTDPEGVDWLTVNPVGGTLAAGSSVEIDVDVIGNELIEDFNHASLCFTTDDDQADLLVVPVTIDANLPDELIIAEEPAGAHLQGAVLTPALVVEVRDSDGILQTGDNDTVVVVSLAVNPGGGTLSGTVAATVESGVVTFDDLSIDVPGDGYRLLVQDDPGELEAVVSKAFDILGPDIFHDRFEPVDQ